MSRWKPNTRERLQRAAVELFVEQGFAKTTVPQITARAGLTTRTFFRHFADKREVLFAGDEEVPERVARLMATAPISLSPMQLIAYGLETIAATVFEGKLAYLRMRRTVIQADASLHERELRKLDTLADAIKQGFRERGLDEMTTMLAAHLAVTVFSITISRWLDQEGERPLVEFVPETLRALRSIAADSTERSAISTS